MVRPLTDEICICEPADMREPEGRGFTPERDCPVHGEVTVFQTAPRCDVRSGPAADLAADVADALTPRDLR